MGQWSVVGYNDIRNVSHIGADCHAPLFDAIRIEGCITNGADCSHRDCRQRPNPQSLQSSNGLVPRWHCWWPTVSVIEC